MRCSQGFLVYPKSPKSEPFLARIGKVQKHSYESEKWRRCTARIFDIGEPQATETLSLDPASLYCAFEQVRDGRSAKGKRYPLPLLLTLLLLGKLAGETSVNGIVEWIKERQTDLRRHLNWPKRFPTNSTYSEALARCDAQEIVTVIASVLLKARAVEQCGDEPSRLQATKQEETLTHVAMDGKTLRGTLGHESEGQPSVHLLSLYECQSGIVLTQRAVQSPRE